MISDDDVMRLFEQADPARRPDRANDHVGGAGYLTALRQRSINVTLTEASQTETQPTAARRWAWIGAVAAATALVIIGGIVLLARDDAPPQTDSSASEVDAVGQFIAALSDRDVAAMEVASTDGFTFDGLSVEELPSVMAYLEAFDLRWEDATCKTSSVGAEVECELSQRNRLTELTGAEIPASLSFTMIDGKVESVDVDADLSDYRSNAYDPFMSWVQLNHRDDFTRMFRGGGPVHSDESAALFDQHLTEYTAHVLSTTDE